jgi:polyisoprenyl-phosphate glycosyltransferase
MDALRRRKDDVETPLLSVVVPMYNEEDGADIFFAAIEPVLQSVTANYEIICIDDGSKDNTLRLLMHHNHRDGRIKVLSLSRNFGKDTALSAGLDYSTGQAVIPIDADLQDPPRLIPRMVEKWREGYEVVFARRAERDTDHPHKRITAGLFYRIFNKVADVSIPENTGDFRLMDRRVVDAVKNLPEKTRFMKGLFAWVGFKQIGLDYRREERAAGTTKWNYWKLWNFALDGITGASSVPLKMWTYLGAFMALAALTYGAWLAIDTAIYGAEIPGYASLMTAVLLLGAFNIIATGIMGEYIGRIYTEVRNRPLYLVRDEHGFSQEHPPSESNTVTELRPRRDPFKNR